MGDLLKQSDADYASRDPAAIRHHSQTTAQARRKLTVVHQIAKAVGGAIPNGRALDIGCGGGTMSHVLACENYSVSAFDISQAAIDLAHETHPGIDFYLGNAVTPELHFAHPDGRLRRGVGFQRLTRDLAGEGMSSAGLYHYHLYDKLGIAPRTRSDLAAMIAATRTISKALALQLIAFYLL